MHLSVLRKYITEGMIQIIADTPLDGFDKIYTIRPNGKISCETTVLSIIKHRNFQEGNCRGFLEIQISTNQNLIDFHIHSIFYSKNKEEPLSLMELSKKKKSKEHSLFFFEKHTIQPELDCMSYLQELKRTDDFICLDYPNKNMYQQVRVTIIQNTKEVIIAFHDSYQNLSFYKTIL